MRTSLLAFVLVGLSTSALACSDAASSPDPATDLGTAASAPSTPAPGAHDGAAPSMPPSKDAGSDAAPPPPSAPPANAPWVEGTFDWSEWQAGDLYADFLNLPKDGNGDEVTQILRPLIPYNAGDQVTTTYFTWTSDGSTIHAGSKTFTVDAKTPNCRLVLMAGHVYTHTPKTGTCPVQMPALTDQEKARVGYWSYSDPGNNSYSDAYIRMELDADRYVHITMQPHVSVFEDVTKYQEEWTDYYLTDPDGTIHGTNPSGVEELTQPAQDVDGKSLNLCDEQGNNCILLHKSN